MRTSDTQQFPSWLRPGCLYTLKAELHIMCGAQVLLISVNKTQHQGLLCLELLLPDGNTDSWWLYEWELGRELEQVKAISYE